MLSREKVPEGPSVFHGQRLGSNSLNSRVMGVIVAGHLERAMASATTVGGLTF